MDNYYSLVDTQVHHHNHFHGHHNTYSTAATSDSFGSFSPVSDEPSPSQRLTSVNACEYETSANAFPGMSLVEQYGTPRSTAAMPEYYMDLQASQATVAPQMTGGYAVNGGYGQPPMTPDRNGSVSSRTSNITPNTPHVMGSYASSVTTPGSSASVHSQAMMCSTTSPDTYYDIHQQHPHPHSHPLQQAHPAFRHAQAQHFREESSPGYILSTPGPDMRGESTNSPTDYVMSFRTESPIKDYFGERSGNLPPPASTLPSTMVGGFSPEGMARRYSSTSSGSSSYSSAPLPMSRQFSRLNEIHRNSEALQRVSSSHEYNKFADQAAAAGGHIVVRNGIRVSKVASGAFKCMVPGCPSRPFKRSEHLKRHVTTHHENKDLFPCEFCGRAFNRKDNWRSHLKLHTISRGKNARTDFFPRAIDVYNDEMCKISKCRPRKDNN